MHHVGQNRSAPHKATILKNKSHLAPHGLQHPNGRSNRKGIAHDLHRAARKGVQPDEAFQQGRFARSVRSNQRDFLSLTDTQRHTVEHVRPALVGFGQVARSDDRITKTLPDRNRACLRRPMGENVSHSRRAKRKNGRRERRPSWVGTGVIHRQRTKYRRRWFCTYRGHSRNPRHPLP